MGQVLKVNGNYDIITAEAGTITLNTGFNVGTVRVTGNLVVDGDTLTVSAENLNVQDNIIILNFGETGTSFSPGGGISLRYAGIQVDRGPILAPASIIYDELSDSWNFAKGTPESSFNYSDSKIRVKEILTNSDIDNGDLILIGTGDGVVKVLGTRTGVGRADAYETRVTDPDDIPNKAYVDIAIQSNPTFQIRSPGSGGAGDTRVVAFDASASYPSTAFPIGNGLYTVINPTSTAYASHISFMVDNNRVAVMTNYSFEMRGLAIFPEDPVGGDITTLPGADTVTIQSTNTNSNIKLETNGTGKVIVTYAMQMNNIGVVPSSVTAVSGTSLIFAGNVGPGTSGLFAVNTSYNDELVLKNRALLFSMIF